MCQLNSTLTHEPTTSKKACKIYKKNWQEYRIMEPLELEANRCGRWTGNREVALVCIFFYVEIDTQLKPHSGVQSDLLQSL